MVTATTLRNRLEVLEQGPGVQKKKIFFIDVGSDEDLTKSQWEAVNHWKQSHPWGQAQIIVFEEV